jgi:hypothetical protein
MVAFWTEFSVYLVLSVVVVTSALLELALEMDHKIFTNSVWNIPLILTVTNMTVVH